MTGFHCEQHSMTRVDIATGVAFDEFVAAFEKAAPPSPPPHSANPVKRWAPPDSNLLGSSQTTQAPQTTL
jgi:hypothetical protein